ncbi:MAG TPA: redoxin domain-containing protein [Planctomycetota bacterium]|nr:redoxin domain-containing protein [Planctomycetota bacterium]
MKSHLVKWDETYRKQGLAIIDIDNGTIDAMDAVKASVEKAKIKYPTAWDEGGKTCDAYGVRSYAHSFLIGTDGKVVWEGFPFEGKIEDREEQLKAELKKVGAEELKKIEEESKEK